MKLGRYRNTTTERKQYLIDFSQWLTPGETLTGTVNVYVAPTTLPPLHVDTLQFTTDHLGLAYYVEGGDSGETYAVSFLVRTSNNERKEVTIFFTIEEENAATGPFQFNPV
jgi:hypothetical protein